MTAPDPLQVAIAQLEAQRALLGDAAVDAAIQALRQNAGPGVKAGAPPAPAVTPTASAASASPAPSSTPRLRQVSVLFVDVADSTAMLQRVGEEDALALVSGAVETFARVVQAHGGQVLRFTGDGLKAAFGSLVSRDDEAVHAVRAGMRVLEAASEHAERIARPLGVPNFGVRVGIHTGMALLGSGMDADRSALGHAVHLAARMEQSAPVGRLRISQETWQQVRGLFRVQAQPPLVVKGHDQPLQTYLVLGDEDESERTIRRSIEGLHAPMVGREPELQRLADLLRGAAARGEPALAVIQGDAGIGKTRLRRELLRRLEVIDGSPGLQAGGVFAGSTAGAQTAAVHCLRVRTQPSGALQPYGLLRQLLSRWLGIADDLAPERARALLVEGLAPWLSQDARVRAMRLGQLVGLDFGAEAGVSALSARELRDHAFGALREALLAMAARAPLLLVLEDLHWADAGSVDFIERLLVPADVPLLLLLVARPAFAPAWLGESAGAAASPQRATLRLAPLPAAHSATLADALLAPVADVPEALRAMLRERAEGNPFFMEELLRMLIDEGAVDTRTRPWRVARERLSKVRVPQTLVGVLQARLDTLSAAEAAALRQASIIGPVFWSAALAALDAAAPAALPALMRRGLIVRRPGSAFAQTDEWAFQHQLLYDVTYATVLRAARRAGHAQAARWLAARVGGREGEFLAVTAEHYERAGESEQALDYYHRALSAAAGRFAHESSLELVERALAQPALVSPWQRFQFLTVRVNAHERLEQRERWQAAHRATTEWAEICNNDIMRADVATASMLRADHEGRPDEARALAERAIALVGASADPKAAAPLTLAHGELAWLAISAGDFARAEPHLAQGLVHARRAALLPKEEGGYDGYELQLRAIAIKALVLQERYVQAAQLTREALDELDRQARNKPHDRYTLLEYLHDAQREIGQRSAARATAQEALQRALDLSMPRLHASALVRVADSALDDRDLSAAAGAVEEALGVLVRAPNEWVRPAVQTAQGRVAAARGDRHAARGAWEQALERFVAQGRRGETDDVRALLAELALQEGDVQQALRRVDELLPDSAGRPGARSEDDPADAPYHAFKASALVSCMRVLEHAGDARAQPILAHLRRRLAAQLEQCPDAGSRERLVREVPHWACVHAAALQAAAPGTGQAGLQVDAVQADSGAT